MALSVVCISSLNSISRGGYGMKLVVISGLSGSGKSTALQALEDLDFYCIDNLPVGLLPAFALQMVNTPQNIYKNAAVCIDARNLTRDLEHFPDVLNELKGSGLSCELVFLQTDDETLLKRFSETRRKHPLTRTGIPLAEAIALERKLVDVLASHADLHIDTSQSTLHQLRDTLRKHMEAQATRSMALLFQSFGYKKGIPTDADFVFDVRCLPNPHWEIHLRPLSGLDPEVVRYLEDQALVGHMFEAIKAFLEVWIPYFEADNRSYMTVALGCTGGQHRSVYLTKLLGDYFRQSRDNVLVRHRELPPIPPRRNFTSPVESS